MKETTNRRLTAVDILNAAANLKREQVECPELGGFIEIQELTAAEAIRIGKRAKGDGKDEAMPDEDAMVAWAIASMINEDGTRTMEDTPENRAKLLGGAAGWVIRVSTAAIRLNGFAQDAVKETEKNSDANQKPA